MGLGEVHGGQNVGFGVVHQRGKLLELLAQLFGNEPVETTSAIGPEDMCACKIRTGDTHIASTAPDARSFEQVLEDRLAAVGVFQQDGDS